MDKKYESLNIHQKMDLLVSEMVDKGVRFRDALKEFQKLYIECAGRKYEGNITKMSDALGVHRNTLHNRVKTLKIKRLSGS
jgi:DNA-binding NtrC family response regulator